MANRRSWLLIVVEMASLGRTAATAQLRPASNALIANLRRVRHRGIVVNARRSAGSCAACAESKAAEAFYRDDG